LYTVIAFARAADGKKRAEARAIAKPDTNFECDIFTPDRIGVKS
jgi:hypothetical protein